MYLRKPNLKLCFYVYIYMYKGVYMYIHVCTCTYIRVTRFEHKIFFNEMLFACTNSYCDQAYDLPMSLKENKTKRVQGTILVW